MAAELGIAFVPGVASKVAELLFDPIRREISYAFKYQNYVEKLKSPLEDLKNKKQRVEQAVNKAKRQGGEIYGDVQSWLDQTTELIKRADILIKEYDDVANNKRCFKGLCPNLMSRRKLSKEAVNAGNVANDLLRKGNDTNVSYLPPPERTELMNDVTGYQQFDSRMKIFQDVMEVLNKVGRIGVYGMGGVGKTTLVKQVAKKVMEEKLLFDEVAMVEVTLNPDLETIQDKIAYDIGFSFPQDESALYARPDRLRQRLKEKRVLVILDNIWAKLDLEAVGIPSGVHDHRQCTILLTSRSQHVLCNDMNSQKTFSIKVLSDEESLGLFWKTVGDQSTQTPDFKHLAVEIVGKCGGLPVAIKTIANALKNKNLSIWKDALNQLRNSNPRHIPGMTANVYSTIQLSYNFLESGDAKSLFRLCALQNDGSQIPIDDLLIYGMGLGWFTNVYSLEEGRNRVHALIDNLKTSCLLLDGDNKHVVKMHDVIHDVAVSIAAEEHMFNIQDVADLKEELEKMMQKYPTAISLPYREIQDLPERLEFPKLELFLLFAKSKLEGNSLQISDLFFEGMKELRVLHLTRIRFLSISSSLGCLTNLRTLSLNYFNSLKDVAIIGKLTKLQILSFRNSNIKQLPLEIGQLTRLKLLDLSNCRSLEVIAPSVISKLYRLEELYMGRSFTNWEKGEGGSNASLDELKALSKLTTLDLHIPNVRVMPQDLVSVELERFEIFIGEVWPYMDLKYERTLTLRVLDKSIILGSGMKKLFQKVEYLHLIGLVGFQKVVNELHDRENFQQLKHLCVGNDSKISGTSSSTPSASKEIVAEDDREDFMTVLFSNKVIFPALEKLVLDSLNMENIWLDPFPTMSTSPCQNLTELMVKNCSRLKFLFTYSMVKSLVRLQKLVIQRCESMERVIDTTGLSRDEEQMIDSEIFPKLEYLDLWNLPKLARFMSTSSSDSEENNIEYLHLNGLVGFQKVVSELHDRENFQQLKHLCVGNDSEISGTSSSTPSASKEIVAEDDREDFMTVLFSNKVIFPALETLVLDSINMENIWLDPTISSYSCQNLTQLTVGGCRRLKFLFTYSMVNSLVRLQILVIQRCESMERVIDTTGLSRDEEQMIDSEIFPKLEYLNLWNLPKLARFMSTSSSNSEENNIFHTGTHSTFFDEKVFFPPLEKLELRSINKEKIWLDPFSTMSTSLCQNLTELRVNNCRRLKFLFTYSMVNSLVRLQKLEILSCESLERVIDTTGLGRDEEQMIDSEIFPQLEHLQLWNLPKLARFMSTSSSDSEENNILHTGTHSTFFDKKVIFPALEKLELQSINVEKIWLDPFSTMSTSPCQNLTELKVVDSSRLKFLLTYSMVSSLVKLQKLEIESCKSMERIIDTTELGRDEEQMIDLEVFPKLEYLKLMGLPKLARFVSMSSSDSEENNILHTGTQSALSDKKHHQFTRDSFSKLKELDVSYCDKVEMLFGCLKLLSPKTDGQHPVLLFDLDKVRLPSLEKLSIGRMENLRKIWQWHPQLTWDSFSKLKELNVSWCYKLTSVFSSNIIMGRRFETLEVLKVERCDSIEEIIEEETSSNSSSRRFDVLPRLIKLRLSGLSKLKSIYQGIHILKWPALKDLYVEGCHKVEILFASSELLESQQPIILVDHHKVVFPNLKTLTVNRCDGLRNLMTLSTAESQVKLARMEISNCKMIEKIIEIQVGEGVKEDPIVFTQLEYLRLRNLPTLESFKVVFPNLKTLKVEECDGLRNLMTLSTAESQVKLARMEISNCKMIEKIIEMQVGEGMKEDPIVFTQLEYLRLDNLPALESFCLENYTLKFPYLEQVIMSACTSMKTFSQGVLDTPMLRKVKLGKGSPMFWRKGSGLGEEGFEERWEGNLNSTIRKMFQGMDLFSGIKDLKLSNFPSLKEIWDGNAHALPVSFFSNLTSLVVDDCTFMLSAIPANLLRFLNNLGHLEVRNCDSVEEVFHLKDQNADEVEDILNAGGFTFWDLKLVDLPKLKRCCNYNGNKIIVGKICRLWIENCPNMKTFISNSTPAHMTANIESQEMTSEENFLTDIQPFVDEKVYFFDLLDCLELKLFKLPKLLHLWKENSYSSNGFKYISRLEISECHKLRQLIPSSVTFECLTTLEVSKCDGLINLVTLSTAKSLANLTRMNVYDCKMIEEIIQQVGKEAEEDCIVFKHLKFLGFSCLPSLTSFCLGNNTLEFPSLEHVFVKECPKMEIFSRGVLSTPNLQRLQLTELDSLEEGCGRWEGSLNFTIQKLFQEMNSKEEN